MTIAQTTRIQQIKDNGCKVNTIAPLDGAAVEVELPWGWLRLDRIGHEVSRLRRDQTAVIGAR